MQTIDAPLTFDYICKLNEFIARNEALEWGTLRKGSVGISGTDYIPPIPEKNALQMFDALQGVFIGCYWVFECEILRKRKR